MVVSAKVPTGQKLEVKTPFGSFYYRDGKGPMSMYNLSGSSMSAVKAVLEQAAIDQVERDAIYLFGAELKTIYTADLSLERNSKKWNPNFKFEFVYVLNMEPEDSDWDGPRGMVTDYLKSDYIEKVRHEAVSGVLMWSSTYDERNHKDLHLKECLMRRCFSINS